MNDMAMLALSGGAGVLLGAIFFGGLWWTVRRSLSSKQPALWLLGSFLLRTSLILTGFYFVAGGYWARLSACLLGFVAGRLLVTRLAHAPVKSGNAATTEITHAPKS